VDTLTKSLRADELPGRSGAAADVGPDCHWTRRRRHRLLRQPQGRITLNDMTVAATVDGQLPTDTVDQLISIQ
jgi:hypothetical protein